MVRFCCITGSTTHQSTTNEESRGGASSAWEAEEELGEPAVRGKEMRSVRLHCAAVKRSQFLFYDQEIREETTQLGDGIDDFPGMIDASADATTGTSDALDEGLEEGLAAASKAVIVGLR